MRPVIQQYRQMHESPELFQGFSIMPHIQRIKGLCDAVEARRLLDYGCGKGRQYEVEHEGIGRLESHWGAEVTKYDPGYEPFADEAVLASDYDGVICTDVLEHAESPEHAANMVFDLFCASTGFVFASVACRPAVKTLPDGRNAHTCIRSPDWWCGVFEAAHAIYPEAKTWKLVCIPEKGERVFVHG